MIIFHAGSPGPAARIYVAGHPRTRSGFTMIELLVVAAIMAILASLLFPLFAMATENAHRVNCLSNQRQLAQAVMMWTQEHSETFPDGALIWDALKLMKVPQKVLSCPTQPDEGLGYDYSNFISNKLLSDVARPSDEIMTVDGYDSPMTLGCMTVSAGNSSWALSPFAVSPGDKLIINASGFATYDNNTNVTDPDGQRWQDGTAEGLLYDPKAIVPTAPLGALVARISVAQNPSAPGATSTAAVDASQPAPFVVGVGTEITVSDRGTLQFLYNAETYQYHSGGNGVYTVNVRDVLADTKGVILPVAHNILCAPEDIAYRHAGRAVASFCDGHVASITSLPRYWMIDVADEADFDTNVLQCPVPVIVDFYAPWSPWSQQMQQVVADIAQSYRGRVQVVTVNGDLFPQLVTRYQVTGYPTLVFFKTGATKGTITGYDVNTKDAISTMLQPLL